jgi:hypothetical protein
MAAGTTLPRMVNPAVELAKIFEGWKTDAQVGPVGARTNYARSLGVAQVEVVNRGMAHVVDLVSRARDLKAGGTDVEPFEWALPRWQAAFIAAAADERAAPLSDAERANFPISIERLNVLKSFGIVLDMHAAALQPRPEFVAGIEAAVDDAEEFVRAAEISEELRHYLLGLLERIRAALREGRPTSMREAVAEFVGATVLVENTVDEEQRSGWAQIRKNLLTPVIAGAGGNLLSQGIGVVVGFIGGAGL